MSTERHQDLVNLPVARHEQEEPEQETEPEYAPSERRLGNEIHRRRHDEGALVALLRGLPPAQRLLGRVMAIRELGSQRGVALCSRAFGAGQGMVPVVPAPPRQEATPGIRARYDFARAGAFRDVIVSLLQPEKAPGPQVLAELLSATGRNVALAALSLLQQGPWSDHQRGMFSKLYIGLRGSAAKDDGHGSDRADGPPATLKGSAALAGAAERRATTIFRREAAQADQADPDHPAVEEALRRRGSGESLAEGMRKEMEAQFGVDFRHVRIHTDEVAVAATNAVQARAFTVGEDIFFAEGAFAPESVAGRQLLTHELTHVVQGYQGRVATPPTGRTQVGQRHDALEQEAEATAGAAPAQALIRQPPGATRMQAPFPAALLRYEDENGNLLPDPVEVTWTSDRFSISFRVIDREGGSLEFAARYLGPHPVDGGPGVQDKTVSLWRPYGQQKLKSRILQQGDRVLDVDLFGNGTSRLRLTDDVRFQDNPAARGRLHDFSIVELGRKVLSGHMAILDPAAKASDVTPGPEQESPGSRPEGLINIAGGFDEYKIDGDGDQYKELLIRFKTKETWPDPTYQDIPKVLTLSMRQLSSPGPELSADINLPRPATRGSLFPLVTEVTDGLVPTRFSLVLPTNSQMLLLFPPERSATETKYTVDVAGQRIYYPFPPEKSQPHRVFTAGPASVIGNIVSTDITMGGYDDRFRLTIEPKPVNRALLGISVLSADEPKGAVSAELQLMKPIVFQVVPISEVRLGLDLDGDGQADLFVHDRLTTPSDDNGGGPPERNRDHQIRITGPAIGGERLFAFHVRDGLHFPSWGGNQDAAANALAVTGLKKQQEEGSFTDQLDSYEQELAKVRKQAVQLGVLQPQTFAAWATLSQAMIRLRPQTEGTVPAALQNEAAQAAAAFFAALKSETDRLGTFPLASGLQYNVYTGETRTSRGVSGAGPELEGDLRAGHWRVAFQKYRRLVEGLDRWIVDRLKQDRPNDKAAQRLGQQAEQQAAMRYKLGPLEDKKPQRILAVFYPDQQFKNEQGYVEQVLLSLYCWREGNTWYLKNLTNPSHPYHVTADATSAGDEPPRALLEKLDDPDRFPAGVVHFQVVGKYGGEVKTRDGLTWKKSFTYLGLGLAALGLTLATFGTAGGVVAVVGSWILAGSAVVGAVGAAVDLVDRIQHGDLDATTAILDVAQIVGGLAGAPAIASGRIVVGASAAARSGSPWALRWARLAVLGGKVALPARIGADVVTMGVVAVNTALQLEEIEHSSATDAEKARAKMQLLFHLALTGGMTALSIKGDLPGYRTGQKLVLEDLGRGPVALLGENAVMMHAGSQTAFIKVRIKAGLGQQVDYVITNVQGLSKEQAELLLTEAQKRGGTVVFGGSRVRGDARASGDKVVSDLDVGFVDLTPGNINKIMNKFNKQFTGSSQGAGRIIEHNWIYPGSKPENIPEIISPEEFFMRSGIRGGQDGPKAGQDFGPSGYIKVSPDGTTEIGRL